MSQSNPVSLRPDGNTWCKICGITQPEHARLCSQLGADAIGLVFVDTSPRAISMDAARRVARAANITRIGLFVDAEPALVTDAIRTCDLDVLQFQGDENPGYCEGFGRPYVKAVRVQADTDIQQLTQSFASAMALQLDAFVEGVAGGTGQQFEWDLWPSKVDLPLILAGGLRPDNVGAAIKRLKPAGVDVSGGVETEVRGEKDPERIRKFVQEVRNVS